LGVSDKFKQGRGLLFFRLILFFGILTFMIILAGLFFSDDEGSASARAQKNNGLSAVL